MNLLVVGTVAFDSISTPFGDAPDTQGGSATYFSVAASHFAKVRLVSVVGDDFEDQHMQVFEGRSIDTSGLARVPGKSFRWKGEYHHDMNEAQTLDTQLNVLESFEAKVPDSYKDSDVVFLANIDPDLQQHVLDQMTAPKLVAADTMNYWIDSKRKSLESLLKRIDCLVINEGECRMLGETTNILKAGRSILDMGPKTLVVKRGEYGVIMMSQDGGVFAAPGLPLEEVVDPTGAGDSFAGGMMGYLSKHETLDDDSLRRALVWGCVMASHTVEGFGLQRLRSVTSDDLDARVKEFERLTHLQRL
jgi:sugar/nucleoside kinase (ribokinase family)